MAEDFETMWNMIETWAITAFIWLTIGFLSVLVLRELLP